MNDKPYKSVKDQVAEQKNKEKKTRAITFSQFKSDMARNPMIFIGLGGSAFLTCLMGIFIGLNPQLDMDGVLIFFGGREGAGAAFLGIFFAILYGAAFPVLGEYGAYYWHRKAVMRDEGNNWQAGISYVTMGIAGTFTIVTAVAASFVLASLLNTFDVFKAIPNWVQFWTILIIPVALAMHAFANIWYDHVSTYALERRTMERNLESAKTEAENRIRQARMNAQEDAATAMAEEYESLATVGAVTAGQNLARTAWKRDSQELGADVNEDGIPDILQKDVVPVRRNNGHGMALDVEDNFSDDGQHPHRPS